MFDFGLLELLVVGVVGLLVLGPTRMPVAVRHAGRMVAKARRAFAAMQQEIDRELEIEELKRSLDQVKQNVQAHSEQANLAANQASESLKQAQLGLRGQPNKDPLNTAQQNKDQRKGVAAPSASNLSTANPIIVNASTANSSMANSNLSAADSIHDLA